MKLIVYKPRSAISIGEPFGEPSFQIGNFFLYSPDLARHFPEKQYFAMFIGEVAIVNYFGIPTEQEYKARDIPIYHQRLTDAIDLSSGICLVGVRKKENVRCENAVWSDVDEFPVRHLPHDMELCLDDYSEPLPDCPAYDLGASIGGNVLWNNGEAFLEWLAEQWGALNLDCCGPRHDSGAELNDPWVAAVGGSAHFVTPNVVANRPIAAGWCLG